MMAGFDYETWWLDYSDVNKLDPGTKLRKKLIIEQIRPKKYKKILDLGCGSGELLEEIKRKFPAKSLYGSDVSTEALRILNKKKITEKTFILDLEKNTQVNGNYDVVICSEVIEHLKNWRSTLKLLAALTKKGSIVIVTTQAGKRYPHHLAIGHLQHFEPKEITTILEIAGFKIKTSKRLGFPFMNIKNLLVTMLFNNESYKSGKISPLQKIGFRVFYYLYQLSIGNWGPQLFIVAEKVN